MAWPVRYKLVGLLATGSMINYADRVNISVAAPVMMAALGWDEARFGLIFSAFLLGYTLLQFPGGVIADRWNTCRVIALACAGFSLFTALTPLGALAFGLMLLIRFCVGLFESVSFPAYAALNARWIPRYEYGRAQTISLSGSHLGQAVAYPLTAWLVSTFSWPTVFYVNALIGGIWLVAWLSFATNTPAEHPRVSAAERREIEMHAAPRTAPSGSLWEVLRSPQVLLLSLAYLCVVYGLWMIILWLPTYLVSARGFSVQTMGWLGIIPTIAGFAGVVSGGTLSDVLLRCGYGTRFARAQAPALCVLLGVPVILAAAFVPWRELSVACLSLYMFLANLGGGACWAIPVELSPKHVGAISGFMNGAGNLAGIFGPMSAGFLVAATGNWTFPFLAIAALLSVAGLVFYFLVVPVPIEIAARAPEAEAAVRVADST
ncbi:MAG: MFS transporter [Candidatus Binatia bacterium]|nr:MFS transporter [Candidatus Binatia bacterium]